MTPIAELIGKVSGLPWTKHVVRNGSREHVSIFGVYDDGETVLPIEWCTSPFCEHNRFMVECAIDHKVDPLACQPPPKLTEALRSLSLSQKPGNGE